MKRKIIVGSRESKLAVVQSMEVADHLRRVLPEAEVRLLTMKTTGDRILDRTLDRIGGKGLFVRELDRALRAGTVDLTVHSLKDVPAELPEDLPLVGYSRRADPRDALVLPRGCTAPDPSLPIGTASFRRRLQLENLYPGFEVRPVRGNLQTRLRKLEEGQYGALVLAAAGLKRMGLEDRIARYFTVDEMIPAAGQGILAIQGRRGEAHDWLAGYADEETAWAARCERAFVRELNGGCSSPVCAYAEIVGGTLLLRGLYYDEGTGRARTGRLSGQVSQAEAVGVRLARVLRDGGEVEP